MSKSRFFNLLLFVSCLIWGFNLSSKLPVNDLKSETETHAALPRFSIPTLNNGQRNILLIGADSIDKTSAHLQGIWMVTYYTTSSTINLWPVYPTIANGEVAVDADLTRTFHLLRDSSFPQLDPQFISTLKLKNFWWSGYLIFDEYATRELLGLINKESDASQSSIDLRELSSLFNVSLDAQSAYQQQMIWLDISCQTILSQESRPVWDKISSLIPDHISSDLDTGLIISEWQILFDDPGIQSCKFPLSDQSP
jgi:hypothetical protein